MFKIAGIQKLSLVDFPGRIAATVFTGGCNLRCPFCHNSGLINDPPEVMTVEELLSFLKSRRGKLTGVCISGGEPCLQEDLPEILRLIRELGFATKLDTNGTVPEMLNTIISQDLVDYVAMDLKSSSKGYGEITGCFGLNLDKIKSSINILAESNLDFELRTTLVLPHHTRDVVEGMADFLREVTARHGRKIPAYFLQPFRPSPEVLDKSLLAPEAETMEEYKGLLSPYCDSVEIRG